MAKTMYRTLAAALLCGAVGFTGTSFAATHHMKHTSKHAVLLHGSKLTEVDRKEWQITAELNRAALAKAAHDEAAVVIIPNTVASADIEDDE